MNELLVALIRRKASEPGSLTHEASKPVWPRLSVVQTPLWAGGDVLDDQQAELADRDLFLATDLGYLARAPLLDRSEHEEFGPDTHPDDADPGWF